VLPAVLSRLLPYPSWEIFGMPAALLRWHRDLVAWERSRLHACSSRPGMSDAFR
jgi:hypothetical protein